MKKKIKLEHLIANNKKWADKIKQRDSRFFLKLSRQQTPQFLWIGCSDSRVPANEITGLLPGEIFVHRNVANIVDPKDLNCQSVIQYAVEILKIKDIIVCGHYDCGGVKAVLDQKRFGQIDVWLNHIRNVQKKHKKELKTLKNLDTRFQRLCELNVLEQTHRVSQSNAVKKAFKEKKDFQIHALIYDIHDGILKPLSDS